MEDFYFDLHMVGSVKARSKEEAEKMINSYNVIGAKLLTASTVKDFQCKKIKVHDVDVIHENPAV